MFDNETFYSDDHFKDKSFRFHCEICDLESVFLLGLLMVFHWGDFKVR
jgi:hypothetical protein